MNYSSDTNACARLTSTRTQSPTCVVETSAIRRSRPPALIRRSARRRRSATGDASARQTSDGETESLAFAVGFRIVQGSYNIVERL